MTRSSQNIFTPISEETVSPGEFLKLLRGDSSNIAASRIQPSKLGSNGFGSIYVQYKFGKLRPITSNIRKKKPTEALPSGTE